MTSKTICLNMIVKDESHIIEETLIKLLDKIHFDYWVISDTGSSDNTKEIITKFFNSKDIKGELHDDEWVDFAFNRTKALEYALNKRIMFSYLTQMIQFTTILKHQIL